MTTQTRETEREANTAREAGRRAAAHDLAELLRSTRVTNAAADERARFNEACASGARPIITTHSGRWVVTHVSYDFWYTTYPEGGNPEDIFGRRSWSGANDATWADLLRQAGVARHPHWARRDEQQ